MDIFQLLTSQVVGIATLVVLVLIAMLIAWLVGFIYARQQRMHDDLIAVLKEARLGVFVTMDEVEAAEHAEPIAQRVATDQRPSHRRQRRFKLPAVAWQQIVRRGAGGLIVIGLAVGGVWLYRLSTTQVQASMAPLSSTVHSIQQRLVDLSTKSTTTLLALAKHQSATHSNQPTSNEPASTPPTIAQRPAGPYGPFIATVQAAETAPPAVPIATIPLTAHGLTLNAPSGWTVAAPNDHTDHLAQPGNPIELWIERFPNQPTTTNLTQWISHRYGAAVSKTAHTSTVAGTPSVSFVQSSPTTAEQSERTVIQLNTVIYVLSQIGPASLATHDPVWQTAQAIVESAQATK